MSDTEKLREELQDCVTHYALMMSNFLDSMDDGQERRFAQLQELQKYIEELKR